MQNRLRAIVNFLPMLAIRFYRRFISPLLPPSCRFYPSCSAYSLECFRHYSVFKALWMTSARILRCNPFNPGGFDPVPLPDGTFFPEAAPDDESA